MPQWHPSFYLTKPTVTSISIKSLGNNSKFSWPTSSTVPSFLSMILLFYNQFHGLSFCRIIVMFYFNRQSFPFSYCVWFLRGCLFISPTSQPPPPTRSPTEPDADALPTDPRADWVHLYRSLLIETVIIQLSWCSSDQIHVDSRSHYLIDVLTIVKEISASC